jgi:regulator of protease activity HflC (stomatin/prohibitin superfamily)
MLEQSPNMDLIGVDAVNITKIALPDSVEKAIEAKNEEQQRSLMYDYRLQVEHKEAERKKIEAQGIHDFEAELPSGISKQYLLLRAIQATETLASAPTSKMVVIGSGQDGLPVILGSQIGMPANSKK